MRILMIFIGCIHRPPIENALSLNLLTRCKASNLLNWELITKYSAENYRYYNMWEGSTDKSSPLYNMTAFKLSFGAKMVPTHEFIRVNKKLLNFVLSLPPKALLKNVYQCN